MLISFEGIDGCGKTTIAKAVYEKLSNLSMKVLLTKEPGDTKMVSTSAIYCFKKTMH